MNLSTIKQIVNSGAPNWQDLILVEVEKDHNEDLNIYRRTRAYVIKALNSTDRYGDAAALLGVSKRTLYRYLGEFNILKAAGKREFYYIEKIPKHVPTKSNCLPG
jgi:hypothetical protein